MEPLEGPPVSSPDPAIIDSVEQPASSSTRAVTDMPFDSPAVMTHTLHMVIPFIHIHALPACYRTCGDEYT